MSLVNPEMSSLQLQQSSISIPNGDITMLRNTVATACGNTTPVTIELAVNGTYIFTDAPYNLYYPTALLICGNVTMIGNNATLQRATTAPYFRLIGVDNAGLLTLENVTLRDGFIDANGGAALVIVGGSAVLNNVLILNNDSIDNTTFLTSGAAVYNYFGYLELNNVEIRDSNTISDLGGGAVNSWGGTFFMRNSRLINNTSSQNGGALSIRIPTYMELEYNEIVNNTAVNGGGMYLEGATTSNHFMMKNCIYNNTMSASPAFAVMASLPQLNATYNYWNGPASANANVAINPVVWVSPSDCTSQTAWDVVLSLPTATPTATPTPPTITPGVCTVQVAVSSINAYISAGKASIALPGSEDHVFGIGDELEVDMRSELYGGIVQVRSQSVLGTYWLEDSQGGVVTLVAGDCAQLPEASEPYDPIQLPTFTNYPLQVTNPSTYSLYQFAILNQIYTTTVWRHPGMDFFQGPVSNGSISVGIRVAAVADGEVIGYFDPPASTAIYGDGPVWVDGVSPTDKISNRAYAVIRHGNTIVVYAHLQPGLRIGDPGDKVIAGQWIGEIASHADGAHLHLEVRTYGLASFDVTNVPLIFVNPWWYFDSINQAHITQNLANRSNDDGQTVATPSTQQTNCLRSSASPPSGAPTSIIGIDVYGLTSGGSPTYRAFEWLDNNMRQEYVVTGNTTAWQTVCIPN